MARTDSWFQGGGLGWLARSLLWTGQCGAVVGTASLAFDVQVGAVAGFVVAAVLLFRHVDALIDERVR